MTRCGFGATASLWGPTHKRWVGCSRPTFTPASEALAPRGPQPLPTHHVVEERPELLPPVLVQPLLVQQRVQQPPQRAGRPALLLLQLAAAAGLARCEHDGGAGVLAGREAAQALGLGAAPRLARLLVQLGDQPGRRPPLRRRRRRRLRQQRLPVQQLRGWGPWAGREGGCMWAAGARPVTLGAPAGRVAISGRSVDANCETRRPARAR
jgi:hypothetical protein